MEGLLKDFELEDKDRSIEALRKWRSAVTLVKNPRRRFHYIVDIDERAVALERQRDIQEIQGGILSNNIRALQELAVLTETCKRVARVMLEVTMRVLQAKATWRLVGLVSSVVGLLCYALSPSFNRLIGGWNSFKVVLYAVFSLVISTTILFAKESCLSAQYVEYKTYLKFAVLLIISLYSFFYDNALNGKPEILSVVSNAAFAVMSLSLSKLVKLGFETGIFSYFLGCLVIQLWAINRKLILVAIIFGCPLFVMQSSQDSDTGVSNGSEVINSNSQTMLTNRGQDSQSLQTNGGQDIHSSSAATPEVDSGGEHVNNNIP